MDEHTISSPPEPPLRQHEPQPPQTGTRSRSICGAIAILSSAFGANLGIHNFMLGRTGLGIAQLVITVLNFFGILISVALMAIVIGVITIWFNLAIMLGMSIWGIVEGVLILAKKDFRDGNGMLLKNDLNPSLPPEHEGVVGEKSRLACGLIGIFLGGLGIHNFMLGYTAKGITQLVFFIICAITVWFGVGLIPLLLMIGWSLADGIIILTNKRYIDADGKLLTD
ncbi:MAG: TM2 domain-containing protein [Defluviitaleaceae bacterium]|nr:TM2 domain-containing protein [Defluviitaleaceae bacterium]